MIQSQNYRGLRGRIARGLGVLACAVGILVGGTARANTFFDFKSDPVAGSPPAVPGFTPAPFLNDGNVAPVNTYLSGQAIKALKINPGTTANPVLSGSTISTIYGNKVINYTFADFEAANYLTQIATLRNQIANSGASGAAGVLAPNVYVGNYDLYPMVSADPTRPAGFTRNMLAEFSSAGVNMANEALYPGQTFRNPLAGDSTAPNIRSALFTMPITRLSLISASLSATQKHIPYITRFNAAGVFNDSGDVNSPTPVRWSNPTGDQMLSRGDFKAMVAHYRLRGANGVHLLGGGVEGYTDQQSQEDVVAGWNIQKINDIFNGGNAKLASLDTVVRTGGVTKTLEDAGVVMSGVYSLTQGKLALLVSNLGDAQQTLTIPQKIGGRTVGGSFQVASNQHKLLEFTGTGTSWVLASQTILFADSFEDIDRSGKGIPEPTMLGGVALLAVVGLARRRRI